MIRMNQVFIDSSTTGTVYGRLSDPSSEHRAVEPAAYPLPGYTQIPTTDKPYRLALISTNDLTRLQRLQPSANTTCSSFQWSFTLLTHKLSSSSLGLTSFHQYISHKPHGVIVLCLCHIAKDDGQHSHLSLLWMQCCTWIVVSARARKEASCKWCRKRGLKRIRAAVSFHGASFVAGESSPTSRPGAGRLASAHC